MGVARKGCKIIERDPTSKPEKGRVKNGVHEMYVAYSSTGQGERRSRGAGRFGLPDRSALVRCFDERGTLQDWYIGDVCGQTRRDLIA